MRPQAQRHQPLGLAFLVADTYCWQHRAYCEQRSAGKNIRKVGGLGHVYRNTGMSAMGARGGALFEREGELRSLDALIEGAAAGAGGVAVVEGPAGIGKSRLIGEARIRGKTAGLRVLSARGGEMEASFAFGVVRQLFEVALADGKVRERWLAGSAVGAASVFGEIDEPSAGGHHDVSVAVLHGLYWLTVNAAADGPLLLAIDDLQWCDRPSLRFLSYLLRRLDGVAVLVVAGLRGGEREADAMLVGEIAGDPGGMSIRPAPLTERGVAGLLGEVMGVHADGAFTKACHDTTGGNPLLVRELLGALVAERVRPDAAHAGAVHDLGPGAVSRTVLLRLARLPGEALAVARAVAVLGDGAAVSTASELTGLAETAVADAIGALVQAQILEPELPMGFVHPLVRAAVYREMAPGQRELRHARAARLLADGGASDEAVAAQLLLVPGRAETWAVDRLQAAGRHAVRAGAPEVAMSYLARALAEPPAAGRRSSVLIDLGMAEALANVPASSVEHLRAGYEALAEPALRAETAEVLARLLIFTAPGAEAAAVARSAAGQLPSEYADLRQGLEAAELYAANFGAPLAGDARARLARARAGGDGDGPGARKLAAVAAWDWALTGGTASQCAELALAALSDGVLVAADPTFLTGVAISVLILADRDETLDLWEATIAEAHRRGSLFALSGIYVCRGWTWLRRGELGEAEDWLRQAINDTTPWQATGPAGTAYAVGWLARVLIERGNVAGARRILSRRGGLAAGSDGDSVCQRAGVELLLAEGQWHEALTAADEYAGRLRRGVVNPAWAPWRSLKAEALGSLGRREEAIALIDEELAWARRWGAPGALGRALRTRGTLEADDGLDALAEAVQVTAPSPARLEHAKAQFALGSVLRRTGQRADARQPLRLALDLALHCAAQPLADRARAELYAAGGRATRPLLTGPESLTPSERRVAGLAAQGQSNRDIAQVLYVTPKTVEVHLSSTYRKLGIRSRAGLAPALSATP